MPRPLLPGSLRTLSTRWVPTHWVAAFALLVGLIAAPGAQAQIFSGSLSLGSQADVEAFADSAYTEVTGSLTIEGADITDVSGLSTLTTVGGSLRVINNPVLSTLDGLDNLTSVASFVDISVNASLQNIQGLQSLTTIGSILQIEDHPVLTSLSGLENLTSIGGFLDLVRNDALTDLRGLEGLTSLPDAFFVISHANLQTLEGLQNLTSVDGRVQIQGNGSLERLRGLGNLSSIGGRLDINSNGALTTLDDLEEILNGAPGSIGADGGTHLRVISNGVLADCDLLYPFVTNPNPPGSISVSGNASGCAGPG
ncbi:MAG: hypothetical protein AAGI71_11945, partial [Bacteroidota bacterium]